MKKFLLFFSFIILSLFICNNVKAYNTNYTLKFTSNDIETFETNLNLGTDVNVLSLSDINDVFLNYYNSNFKNIFPYYILIANGDVSANKRVMFYPLFFKNLPDDISLHSNFNSRQTYIYSYISTSLDTYGYNQRSGGHSIICGDGWGNCLNNFSDYFNNLSTSITLNKNSYNEITIFSRSASDFNINNNIYTSKNGQSFFILSSNLDIYNNYISNGINSSLFFNYEFLDTPTVLLDSSQIYTSYISSINREPEINFTISNNLNSSGNTISKNVNFILSNFFDTSMSFQVKYPNSENYISLDVPTDNYNFTIFNNGNYLFRIIDNFTNEIYDSLTLSVVDIVEFSTPNVNLITNVPDECLVKFNNIDYKVCEFLDLNITGSSGNFLNQYKINNGEWVDIYYNNFQQTFSFNENSNFYFRTVDLNNGSYLNQHTIAIVGIDDISSFGPRAIPILKTSIYNYPYLNFLLYNFLDNYTFQAKLSSDEEFTTLPVDCSSLYVCQSNFYENITGKTVYFRILDSNNNVIFNDIYLLDMFNYGNNVINKFIGNLNNDFTSSLAKIVNLPINYYRYLINSAEICQPLNLPLPFFNTNISLPCVSTIFKSFNEDIYNLIKSCIHGVISFYLLINSYYLLKRSISPDDKRKEKDF